MSKPKGRHAKVRKSKGTVRKVSELLNSTARLVRAVGVLVDALASGSAEPTPCQGNHPVAAGWLPTIMAGTAPPCSLTDGTHRGCPRSGFGASGRTARDVRGPWWAWEVGYRCRPGPRSRAGTPGRCAKASKKDKGRIFG